MSSKPPPALLEPYLHLPPETSLLTLTGTLDCSIHWLTARFIASALAASSSSSSHSQQDSSIVLVSWMRDFTFWRGEIRRTTGLDISKYPRKFTYIDQFSNHHQASSSPSSLQDLQSQILSALQQQQQQQQTRKENENNPNNPPTTTTTLLILDAPDVLLATTSTTADELNHFLLQLRSHQVHGTTILSCSADFPLISAATTTTAGNNSNPTSAIEKATAAFITAQAHSSRLVMSVRGLETGAARDVSGVLRITRGGDVEGGDEVREAELLYLIQRDGVAKVFSRGSGPVS